MERKETQRTTICNNGVNDNNAKNVIYQCFQMQEQYT